MTNAFDAYLRERHTEIVDVHVVLTDVAGRVLLGLRSGTGYADGYWHLPSGHLEAGESVTAAAVREGKEETGVHIVEADLEFVHVMHRAGQRGRIGFFFTTRTWSGEPVNAEPDKCAALEWFAPAALPEPMLAYGAAALARIARGERFSLWEW